MCRIIEEMCEEAFREGVEHERLATVKRMLDEHLPLETISEATELPPDEVARLQAESPCSQAP